MVYVFLANGFEELEALAPIDILRRAGVKVEVVGVDSENIVSAHKVKFTADTTVDKILLDDNVDMIVLPGGMPGVTYLGNHEGLTDLLVKFAEEGKEIAAICAAPSVLGKLGIVKGKKATIYPGMEEKLEGADVVVDQEVVTDGNITTSRGAGTAIPFALRLIEILNGEEMAKSVSRGIVYSCTE